MGRSRQKHKEQGTFKSTMQPTLRSPDPQKYRPARDPNDTGPYKTAGVTIKERGIDVTNVPMNRRESFKDRALIEQAANEAEAKAIAIKSLLSQPAQEQPAQASQKGKGYAGYVNPNLAVTSADNLFGIFAIFNKKARS